MRPLLDDPAAVEDDDLAGVADSGEAMRDRDRRPAFREPVERLLDGPAQSACRGRSLPRPGRALGGLEGFVRAIAIRCFSPPEKR